jgi:hypothetical protein
MKRCPQCEFIYEDDQSLCDMDGALLVFDARTLPNLHALAPVEVPLAPRAHWRHRTFPAMAALILATVLSLVYFVSTQRTAPVRTSMPAMPLTSAPTTTAPTISSAAPAAESNQTLPAPAATEVKAATVTTKDQATPAANTSSPVATKKATAKTATTQPKPEEPKKDDSKVGSILKKTGRLLKKPFKF